MECFGDARDAGGIFRAVSVSGRHHDRLHPPGNDLRPGGHFSSRCKYSDPGSTGNKFATIEFLCFWCFHSVTVLHGGRLKMKLFTAIVVGVIGVLMTPVPAALNFTMK